MFCESIGSGLRVKKAGTEAPFSCLWRYIKIEHLSKWSPRHSCVRANFADVEMSKEMSRFAEFKTLTDNVGERVISSFLCRPSVWRNLDEWRKAEATQEWRSKTAKRWDKHRVGEEGAHEDMDDDVEDMMCQGHVKLFRTTRVTRGRPGVGNELHSVLAKGERNRDRKNAGGGYNDSVIKPTRQGKRKPAHLVLHCSAGAWRRPWRTRLEN